MSICKLNARNSTFLDSPAGPSRTPPTCHLGARADFPAFEGQPLEHATQLVDLNHTAPCHGTLTSWHYCHYPIVGTVTVSFQVWRRRGTHQLDLVRSQEFSITGGQGGHLTCQTFALASAEAFGVLPRDILGAYVKHRHGELGAVHASSKGSGTSQLYQIDAISEPNTIKISTLSVLNQAVLRLFADIQPETGGVRNGSSLYSSSCYCLCHHT